MAPVMPASTSTVKIPPSLHPPSKVREQNPKNSVYIGSVNHQQNYIEYYAKGPLFSMPEQGSCRTSAEEALTGRKLGPLEPPDRVSKPHRQLINQQGSELLVVVIIWFLQVFPTSASH